jgi:flagellar motor switch protein FliG
MGDGSLTQDQVNALLKGADEASSGEKGPDEKNNSQKTDDTAAAAEKIAEYLRYTTSAVRGLFVDYNLACDIVSVAHYRPADKGAAWNRRMVFASVRSEKPGTPGAVCLFDYRDSRKITAVMTGKDVPVNLSDEGEMTDSEISTMDVFFAGFCDASVRLLSGDPVNKTVDFQKHYDGNAEDFIQSGDWLYAVEASFKIVTLHAARVVMDVPLYIFLNTAMYELIMNADMQQAEAPSSLSGCTVKTRRKTPAESFIDKLKNYMDDRGRKSLKKKNLLSFYNDVLDPDEKRYIAGTDYAIPLTWRGRKKVLMKLKEAVNIQGNPAGEALYSSIEQCRFPVSLRVMDRYVSPAEISGRGALPSPESFTGSSASLFIGNSEIASAMIRGRRSGLYIEILETESDRRPGDFSVIDTCFAFPLKISVETGRKIIPLDAAGKIGKDSFFKFDKYAGEPVDIVLDDYDITIARGEAVVVGENMGVRVTEMEDVSIFDVISGNVRPGRHIGSGPDVTLRCILGRSGLSLKDVSGLGAGSVIGLDCTASGPAELLAGEGNRFDAEIVVIDEFFGARVVDRGRMPVSRDTGEQGDRKSTAARKAKTAADEVKEKRVSTADLVKKAADMIKKNMKYAVSALDTMYSANPVEAASLLIVIGAEKSSMLLTNIGVDRSKSLLEAVASVESVHEENAVRALSRFTAIWEKLAASFEGGEKFARSLLEKSFGSDAAPEIAGNIRLCGGRRPFGFLAGVNPEHLVNFLSGEHPQVTALVLSYLEPPLSGLMLAAFPEPVQVDVAERIASMGMVSSHVVDAVEKVLERKVSMMAGKNCMHSGGIDAVVEMLNSADRLTEKTVIEGMEKDDPELAEEIKKRMFIFEDMVFLDDRSIQKVLREVDSQDLAKALKGTSTGVQEKFFRNMSRRAGVLLREDMDFMGPILLSDVMDAQAKIVNITRALEMAGEIIVARAGEDDLVV